MPTTKKAPNKSAKDSELVDETRTESSENKGTGRRLKDGVYSKGSVRKLNLDRRDKDNDRRSDIDPNYKGPIRRYNIDTEANRKDRRNKD
jgi:hypothetical protein